MTSPINTAVRSLLDEVSVGVLATVRPDGRPRQSVVYFVLDDERLLVSTEARRRKARDVAATGWASLCVTGPTRPHPSVTLEGPAEVLTTGIAEATTRIMERIRGAPADRVPTEDQLAAAGRVILSVTVARAYGASYLQTADHPDH